MKGIGYCKTESLINLQFRMFFMVKYKYITGIHIMISQKLAMFSWHCLKFRPIQTLSAETTFSFTDNPKIWGLRYDKIKVLNCVKITFLSDLPSRPTQFRREHIVLLLLSSSNRPIPFSNNNLHLQGGPKKRYPNFIFAITSVNVYRF